MTGDEGSNSGAPVRPDDAASPLSIRLFGPFEVLVNGQPLPRLRFRKSQSVLALLALRPGHGYPQSGRLERDWLAGLLWPDSSQPAALHSLRNCLSDLRSALGPEAGRLRTLSPRTLSLDLIGAFVDVAAFDAALARGDPESLEAAVTLRRGPLLEACAEAWVFQERQAREQAYLTAREQLAALALARGEAAGAERHLRMAVTADPLRESAQRALMEVLAAGGNYPAALLVYRELRQRLYRDLNAEPDPETQALFQRLRGETREKAGVRRQTSDVSLQRSDVREINDPAKRTPSTLPELASGVWRLPSPHGENRLVTVLFADMSRSVETMRDLDPEEAAALVNRLLGLMVDAILKFGGQVDRFLGDGVLAVFGIPQAHEDDAERAIRAALEIRAAAARTGHPITAGINTGTVYAGTVGTEQHRETTVIGPVVNLAARLREQAGPGQILIGDATYHLTRRAFEFSPHSVAAKGIAEPVTAYDVARALTRPEKARGIEGRTAPLIGREEELARLRGALACLLPPDLAGAASVEAAGGQVVCLIGEAGVGKSRLVAELNGAVTRDELRVTSNDGPRSSLVTCHSSLLRLEGRCLELSMTTGYSIFLDLFHDYFAWMPEEYSIRPPFGGHPPSFAGYPARGGSLARGERLAAWLRECLARDELAAERVEEMGPLLGNLLSARFQSDWDERLQKASPEQVQYQTFLAVRDFFMVLSQRQPLLLVLEDLHWADRLSLSLIAFLMEALARAPIGLLCIYRPERVDSRSTGMRCAHLAAIAERKCPERFTEIRLRELTPEQSGQLVASLLPVDNLPRWMDALIRQKSQGNPFYLEELVRSLIDSRLVYREGDRWLAQEPGTREAGGETLRVPESVQSLILSRSDRLRPELKQLLQCAAVIGRLFRPRLLERVVALRQTPDARENSPAPLATGDWRLASALGELEDQGLVYEERAVPEVEYSFRHVLMQETIYRSLLRPRRAELHQQVAEAMEALYRDGLYEHYEQLAYHYERSAAEEKAIEYLLNAGQKAKGAYLNDDAIGYFQRALKRLQGTSHASRGEKGEPHKGSDRALHAPRSTLHCLQGLGEIYQGIGKHSEAEERFRQAIALGHELRLSPQELARLYFGLGDALVWQGRAEEMIGPAEEVLGLLGEHSESTEAALLNEIVGMGYRWKGDRDKALEYIRRNARFLQRIPYSPELASLYSSILTMYSKEEDNVEEAARWAQIYEGKARRHHDLRALAGVLELRSGLLQVRGDLRGAIPPLQQALEPYGKIGGIQHQFLCYMRLRESFFLLGDLPEAERYGTKQLEAAAAMGDHRCVVVALVGIGKVYLSQGRWGEGMDAYQKAAQASGEDRQMRAWAAYALGRASLAQGQRPEALKQLQEAIAFDEPQPLHLVDLLSGLEEAFDDSEAFLAFCRRYRAEHPRTDESPFVRWHLEPARPDFGFRVPGARVPEVQNGEWVWHDPFGDCAFTVRDGLEIGAANGRDLCHPNRSAPRLLRAVDASPRFAGSPAGGADFAIQTVCRSVSEARPAVGGLLLWRNEEHYLRLDWGALGPHQVSLGGCLPGKQVDAMVRWARKDVIIGRGRLVSERIFLRLERRGRSVRALCSADGQRWFIVGQVEFPAEGRLEAGLHAIGSIDRMIYPGAYPEGTAIRFEAVEVWR